MTAIPRVFRAFVVERRADHLERGVRTLSPDELPPGQVEIRVGWSSVNYKDGLAARWDGKVARISPLVPGIDLAGVVVRSETAGVRAGDDVLAHGYELGVSHHGGFAEYARLPAEWVVPLPPGLSARETMALGTAGFTAGLSVARLEERGLTPDDGPVLVTGATGGVGSTAIAILAERGYEVWALTGKSDEHNWLRSLGAAGFLGRDDAPAEGPPLERERWAAVIDPVGGATLPYGLRSLRRGGAVALSGNVGGAAFATTVFPFILRGVALLGVDSAYLRSDERRRIWTRLATDLRPRDLGGRLTVVTLDELEAALDAILAGQARGRWIVRLGS
jgi:putative YhdH/YhfP family quinone oxidoreductase